MAYVPDEADKRCEEISGKAWKLYTLYCRFANKKGVAWPSLETIARERNWTKPNACKARKELVSQSWVSIIEGDKVQLEIGFKRFQNGNETVSKMETPDFQNGNADFQNGNADFQNGNADFQNGNEIVSKMEMTCKEEPAHKEPAQLTSPINQKEIHVSRFENQAKEIFDFWKTTLEHPTVKFTPDKKTKIIARLREGYTVDDLRLAISGCRASPYHQGQNDQGKLYDGVDLIFRNGAKVDQFIGYAQKTPALVRASNGNGAFTNSLIENNKRAIEQAKREMAELLETRNATNGL